MSRVGAALRLVGRWIRRIPAMVVFVGFFLGEILLANLRVAWEVVTPDYRMKAGIVRIPTETRTPLEVTVLANLITMTPGTLTLDVDLDTYELYVHGLYVYDLDDFRASIARIERHMLRAMR